MIANRLIYFIVAAFITGNLILIFIKYNSDKNIQNLVSDNESLLNEFKVSNQLKTLEKDVVLVDSKIRGAISSKDSTYMEGVELQMAKMKSDLDILQKLAGNGSSEEDIDQLYYVVQEKLKFDSQILDVNARQGKTAADAILASPRGKRLTDSILLLTQKINNTRQNMLSRVTDAIDDSVKKVERLNSILIVFVLISAAVLFWYIVNTIRTQNRLIQQVSDSEKKTKEAARVKENFLANMSHEIRTPMNAILGFTNLLQHKNLDEESGFYVQTIQRSGENLLSIINDILDLSKIEAGMMRIERAPFSLQGLLHSIETMFQAKAKEKGIQLFTDVEASLPDTLDGDATRLTQILVNLIGNAIKFTARGNVSIAVKHKGSDGDTIMVGIEVSDTGIGIEKEKLEQIFDRFQQADDEVTRAYGGTGLGLSIVKELIQLQQGSIEAESEPGKGTTFYITMPYKVSTVQVQPSITTPTQKSVEPASLQHVRILIVEDNEVNQTLLQHIFRNWQVRYEIANNGVEAIEKVNDGTYDLILMDIQMPQMDGYAATRQIRNQLKINTPIIAMTAHAMAGEREKCLSYGMDEYISKPVREEQLKKLIAQFVPFTTPLPSHSKAEAVLVRHTYTYIDLGYMKEVGGGNIEYEREVTLQFIEAIPQALKDLEEAGQSNNKNQMQQIAHNLRTTVSVMGLTEVLQPYLDEIEYGDSNENQLNESIEKVRNICSNALPEAKAYLSSITQ
jgi:signal transduction histidine kinase/ActR/RegA family two-component response regulator